MKNLFDVLNLLPTHTSNHQARVLHPHTHCQSSPTKYWKCCSDNHIISSFNNSLVLFIVLFHLTGYKNQYADTQKYISIVTVSNKLWLSDHNSAELTKGTKYKRPEITTFNLMRARCSSIHSKSIKCQPSTCCSVTPDRLLFIHHSNCARVGVLHIRQDQTTVGTHSILHRVSNLSFTVLFYSHRQPRPKVNVIYFSTLFIGKWCDGINRSKWKQLPSTGGADESSEKMYLNNRQKSVCSCGAEKSV